MDIKWTASKIEEAWQELYNRQHKIPTYREFKGAYPGAMNAIALGRIPGITTYSNFIQHMLKGKPLVFEQKLEPLITPDILTKAICNGFKNANENIDYEDCKTCANIVLNLMGYNGQILDNLLEQSERDLFYRLEELNIVATSQTYETLYDGREWRIFTWRMNVSKILELYEDKKNHAKKTDLNSFTSLADVYYQLPEEAWQRSIEQKDSVRT
ncbi:MAG: DUF6015 family protein [Candidatus Nanoarchaeia archaeon]